MSKNRIFNLTNKELECQTVIDLERVCAIKFIDVNTVKIIFDGVSSDWCLTTNTIDKLLQQFIEYKTDCPYAPPLKKPLPTSGTEIKAI